MKDTIIVNLFGGPGCGKSTGATYIFSRLKLLGYDVEYVSEFAKDKVWENNPQVFHNQFYITGKQSWKIDRCFGKVDIIVTDSPIILGALYCRPDQPALKEAAAEDFLHYGNHNFNIVLNSVKPYNSNGRNQTEDQAKDIDDKIRDLLTCRNIHYLTSNGDEEGYNEIVSLVEQIVKK